MLCVRNFCFFNNFTRDISTEYSSLSSNTVTVLITFEYQKKEVRNDIISHQASGDNLGYGEMCPIWAAIAIVLHIVEYDFMPDKLKDISINYIQLDGKGFTIPSSMILLRIRQAVSSLGQAVLGFSPDEVGTHSNRSGGAMGMFLAGTPVYTITHFCMS